MRMIQALHRQTHRSAVNVDPAGGAGGQEGPGYRNHRSSEQLMRPKSVRKAMVGSDGRGTQHSHQKTLFLFSQTHLKMVSAFADIEEDAPHFSSSAASQKAKFSPGDTNTPLSELWKRTPLQKQQSVGGAGLRPPDDDRLSCQRAKDVERVRVKAPPL